MEENLKTDLMEGVLRTPDEFFENLPGFSYKPNYEMVDGLRIHYVNEGPSDAKPILLMHGEPTWSYLYRKMILILSQDHQVIAPDLIGFGRSDKLAHQKDHSYALHVNLMTKFVRQLNLEGITYFGQDWGGLIGLRVVANEPDRFARIVVGNTGLPDTGKIMSYIGPLIFNLKTRLEGNVDYKKLQEKPGLFSWVRFATTTEDFPVGKILQFGTTTDLPPEVLQAYEAPFPEDKYKSGPRVMPSLIVSNLYENRLAWNNVLSKWEKPFLTSFSDMDRVTQGGEKVFIDRIPGARSQKHVIIEGAGHFLQEDNGEKLARVILEFIDQNKQL
jgi:haloalkane dehalogenase